MLKTFKFSNCLSYRDEQIFDLTSQPLKEYKDYLHTALLFDPGLRLLKSVGIYGHNSHGKTNFIKAYQVFAKMIFSNVIDVDHFHHGQTYSLQSEPTCFEIEFVLDEIKYRYRSRVFEKEIESEELYYAEPKIRENYLFIRYKQEIKLSKPWQKMSNKKLDLAVFFTQPNQLLLSILVAQEGIPHIDAIAKWLKGNIIIPDDFNKSQEERAMMIPFHKDYQQLLYQFLEKADLGLDMVLDKIGCPECQKRSIDGDLLSIWREKRKVNIESCPLHKDLEDFSRIETWKNESAGAYRYFMLSCYLAFAIKNKQLVFVDELDSKLHVLLLQFLMKTFNDPNINSTGSQLIFTTHNTGLLSNQLFRRDQFLVVEKDETGASTLRKMYTPECPIRADSSLEKEYTKGKIGGISQRLRALVAH